MGGNVGTCSTAITSNALTAIGLATGGAAIAAGVIVKQPALAVGGTCLAMVSLTGIVLMSVRSWITDVSAERHQLQLAARDLDAERTKYIASQAALQEERSRMRTDLANEQARTRQQLEQEREAIRQEFDDQRGQLICETFEETVRLIRAGLLDPQEPGAIGTVVPFPGHGHPAEHGQVRGRDVSR
ncbi:hypothetical protein ACFV1F_17155 [Streptomyces sp. NPDC059590]|uniref:hypothetical protein n=1 Tax=Streptomyces sp. NPDC059590 TaxID=3346877 RepID=UPI00368EBFF4